MNLAEHAEPLATDIAFWMLSLRNPKCTIAQMGGMTLDLGDKLRALGIILLLTRADSDGFYFNLIRSARLRRDYLQRVVDAGATDDHHYAAGRYMPLLDAIAAGEIELAREIAALSPAEFREGHEYEDDYCYAQLLHRFIQEPVPEAELPPLLVRFENYLQGAIDPRFDVCQALANRDQDEFDSAFESFLTAFEMMIAANKERGQLEEPQVVAQREVSVEGLALLRIAERRGLQTSDEYRYCPSLARVPMLSPFPGE
jgi:hypothetical protein